MRLIRRMDITNKTEHWGPCPGGTFWALDGAHDFALLGVRIAFADPVYLMRHGILYMQDTFYPDSWAIVSCPDDLRRFSTRWKTDEEGFPYPVVLPFLPEFYYVSRTFRGSRAVARAIRRARVYSL